MCYERIKNIFNATLCILLKHTNNKHNIQVMLWEIFKTFLGNTTLKENFQICKFFKH